MSRDNSLFGAKVVKNIEKQSFVEDITKKIGE